MISGKGFYVWQLTDSLMDSPADFALKCRTNGFSHVLIKIANGIAAFNIYNGIDLVRLFVEACHAQGVQVYGWHYVYHYNPAAEAQLAARRVQETGVDGYVIDAEAECKANGAAASKAYMNELRKQLPTTEIGLSSYRWPSYHPELAWSTYLGGVNFVMPQVYWVKANNPGDQLGRSYLEYQQRAPGLPFIPTGAAYHENGWQPTIQQIDEFYQTVRLMGLLGFNYWEWCNSLRYGLWQTVADQGEALPPVPEPEPSKLSVLVERLNIRPEARIDNSLGLKGQLFKGTEAGVLDLVEVNGQTWALMELYGWVCVDDGNGNVLCEVH